MTALFQPEISTIEAQIAQLQSQLASLNKAEFVADGILQAVASGIEELSTLRADAVTRLREAVLSLFQGGDNFDDGNGNLPLEPTPQPNDDGGEQEPEEAQALPWHELPFDFEKQAVSEEVVVEPAIAVESLTGQSCEWASPWASPLATPLCCQMEDCPQSVLAGQSVELACVISDTPKKPEYIELVPVSHEVAYQRRTHDGEIICAYLGGNNKQKLKLWGEWLCHQHSVGSGFQLREAERLTAFKHEIKIWGMSLKQIERLAESNTQKNPPSNYGDTPKRKAEPVAPLPVSIDVNDVPVGVRLERTDDALITEYRVWAWSIVRVFGRPEVQQKCLGTLIETIDGISTCRPHGFSTQIFQDTANALKYLMQGAGLKLADVVAAYQQRQSEAAIAAIPAVSSERAKADLFGGGYDIPALADAFGGFSF